MVYTEKCIGSVENIDAGLDSFRAQGFRVSSASLFCNLRWRQSMATSSGTRQLASARALLTKHQKMHKKKQEKIGMQAYEGEVFAFSAFVYLLNQRTKRRPRC